MCPCRRTSFGQVSCDKTFVWSFPNDLLNICEFQSYEEVIGLDLNYQEINVLKEDSFAFFESLATLSVSQNNLQTIQTNAFHGLNKMRFLSLAYNNLSNVEPGAFDGLITAKKIILRGNPFLKKLITR